MKALLSVLFFLCFAVINIPLTALAEIRYTGKVFDPNSNKQKLLYTYKSETQEMGNEILVTNEFKYPDGRLASHEEIAFLKDGSIRRLKLSQKQLGAEGLLEIAEGKAKFTYTRDGKTKTDTRDAGPDFIIGSQIPLTLEASWDKLMRGEKIRRRLAVLERLDDFGFEYSKDRETDIDGRKAIVIKMKPTSFFVSALVSPLYFFMSADGKTLLEIHGRTTVKADVNGKFKDLDAVVVYEKPSAQSAAAAAAVVPTAKPSAGNSK